MSIENGKKVTMEFTLKLEDGSEFVSNVGGDALEFTHGEGEIFPALEAEIVGLDIGDTKTVKLEADEAFGQKKEDAFHNVPIDQIPENARTPGSMLVLNRPDGQQEQVRVHDISDEEVTIDFNHPLAGENLMFEVKILAVQ